MKENSLPRLGVITSPYMTEKEAPFEAYKKSFFSHKKLLKRLREEELKVFSDSLPGVVTCGGSLHQIGHPYIRIYKDIGEKKACKKILFYSRAASSKARLVNQVYGVFGGRPTLFADLQCRFPDGIFSIKNGVGN